MMIKPFSASPTSSGRKCSDLPSLSAADDFLQYCFLCKQKLLPSKDIYMYKGDRAFCSEECRCRQIFMDEEETMKPESAHFSSDAIKPQPPTPPSSSSPRHKGPRNRANASPF